MGLRGCTKDAKGTPQLTSTIAEEAMLEFIEKHRSNQAVIDGLAAVSSSEAEFLKFLKIQLDSANKKNSEPLFQAPILRPTDDKAKDLERFAQVYNQANNKCEAIKKIAQERKSGVKKSCAADQAKYREIMEDRQRCNPKMESSSACELSFYQALAELASCQEYNISQIGVTETTRAKGLSFEKPCAISLKGASAAIGAGTIEVQANGEIKTIEWSAGYDLGCNSNDLNFWRAQLGPKFAEAFSVADKSSHPKGVSGAGTQR